MHTCFGCRSSDASPPSAMVLDPYDYVHGVVGGAFALVFPDPAVRERLGLVGISRPVGDGLAWYLWLAGRPGAYELALAAEATDLARRSALLTLRYFPDPGEPVFHGFASAERRVRLTSLFDATGTPARDRADDLDPRWFVVARLAVEPQGADRFILRAWLPERWIEERGEGPQRCRERDLPAAAVARPLLDAFVGGVAYLGRAAPASLRVWRRPATRPREVAPDTWEQSSDADGIDWILEWTGLAVPGLGHGYAAAASVADDSGVPWFDHASRCAPVDPPWPVSALWWDAATWQFDAVGEFCGHCAREAAPAATNESRAPGDPPACGQPSESSP